MDERVTTLLSLFANDVTINERWSAARELMAARQLLSVIETDEFKSGFQAIGDKAKNGSDIERLVSVELLIRLSKFAKKLAPVTKDILCESMTDDFPALSLLGEADDLPAGSKSAELRENIAIALKYATGSWVIPYIITALVEEDRSQRSRLELARQLADREESIDQWLDWIVQLPLAKIIRPEENPENASTKLRDITNALADAIRQNRARLKASQEAGILLARLCRNTVHVSKKTARPKRLAAGATAAVNFLDEVISVRLTLIVEPETYSALETIEWWWRPLAYPKLLKDALQPITDKLITGITLRARWGQKSDSLSTRLKQSLQDRDAAVRRLRQIADQETGLQEEIDDWLRGHVRKSYTDVGSVATSLQAVAKEDLTKEIAKILLDTKEADEVMTNISNRNSLHHVRRLINSIKSLASQLRLETVGREGEFVEYLPLAHETTSGQKPDDSRVEIIRPMVVRKRRDGSEDIIIRAIVSDLKLQSTAMGKVYQIREENNEY